MRSIIQTGKYCFKTGNTDCLDKHHVFNGNGLREWSDKNGLWVWLSHSVHMNLHENSKFSIELKRVGQYCYEKEHTRNEFMAHTRKNYLTTELSDEEKSKYNVDVIEFDILNDDLESLLRS